MTTEEENRARMERGEDGYYPPEPTRALKYGAPCYLCAASFNGGDCEFRKPCIGGNVGCINWPSIYADGQP